MTDDVEKPTVQVRLNGRSYRAKWSGKRWHGTYPDIYAVSDAVHKDGIESFIIDYVDEEK